MSDLGEYSGASPRVPGRIRIALAALWREGSGGPEILLARRLPGARCGGLWELPGGRIEEGEEAASAAARELREETGIEVDGSAGETLLSIAPEVSPDLSFEIVAFAASRPAAPRPIVCQDPSWHPFAALASLPFPPANVAMAAALIAALDGCVARHRNVGRERIH